MSKGAKKQSRKSHSTKTAGGQIPPSGNFQRSYEKCFRMVRDGHQRQAHTLLTELMTSAPDDKYRALITNDLGALAAMDGEDHTAQNLFHKALAIDPTCKVAQANLALLTDVETVSSGSNVETMEVSGRTNANFTSSTSLLEPPPLKLYGLLITRDDQAIFEEWCRDQLPLYDAVVCLDGSTTDATARLADSFADRLIYLHERDFVISHKTDHGLRRIVHRVIVERFGTGNWIMCCHVDEFCYHDPRLIAIKAKREGFDQVAWYSPHFYPHPDELSDWDQRRHWPVTERHHFYHWSYRGSGLPWVEDRLYLNSAGVEWDEQTHGNVRPHGLRNPAPFRPILRHHKVVITDLSWYDVDVFDNSSKYRHHWPGQEHRTGLPFQVRSLKDLFVRSVSSGAQNQPPSCA